MVIAEILTTGEEVLSGQITDTNAVWLSQWLAEQGLRLQRRHTVGDRLEDLVAILRERSAVADVLIVNGGLGPTVDDLSAEAAAQAAGQPLVEFPEWVSALKLKFEKMNRIMPPQNLKQALLPANATILDNPVGTACGFMMSIGKATVFFTPGPPFELKRMMNDQVGPALMRQFQLAPCHYLKTINSFGLAEAKVDGLMAGLELPPEVQLGFRSHFPFIETKLMSWGLETEKRNRVLNDLEAQVREKLGDFLAYEDAASLPHWLLERMRGEGYTLALAESCTGGMVSDQLVSVPNSSAFFDRGMVTYTNQAKMDMLDVPANVLAAKGAVSLETARAMAAGAKHRAGTTHALSITGVAGPGGGTEAKPVGLVGFGLATPQGVYSQLLRLPNWGRTRIRKISATLSLDMLRRHLVGADVFGRFDYADIRETDFSPKTPS